MDNMLDRNIKESLLKEANEIVEPKDMFLKIREVSERKKVRKDHSGFLRYNMRKWVPVACCFALIISVFALSPGMRALAEELIRTIFVVDLDESGSPVVTEKPVQEVLLTPVFGDATYLNDDQLTEKVGVPVYFPDTIDNFKLADKSLVVRLGKDLSLDKIHSLMNRMKAAIDSDDELKGLADYDAYRLVTATYIPDNIYASYLEGSTSWEEAIKKSFDITISPHGLSNYQVDGINIIGVNIFDHPGYWVKSPFAKYPIIEIDGLLTSDMTKPPEKITDLYSLHWVTNSVNYNLMSAGDVQLTQDEAVQFAEAFYSAQQKQ